MDLPFDLFESPFQQQMGFATAVNTVDDLSFCSSIEEKRRNSEQIVVTGRRSWKLLKGKKEAVWPPNLSGQMVYAQTTQELIYLSTEKLCCLRVGPYFFSAIFPYRLI